MRLAIVDSLQVVRAVERALGGTSHVIVWHTGSGHEALRRCDVEPPQLVLVGLRVNDVKTVELTRRLVKDKACQVVLLAGASGDVSNAYDAMGAGAIDVVKAPSFDTEGQLLGAESLQAKLRTASRLLGHSSVQPPPPVPAPAAQAPLIAIGASTGGPQAMSSLLSALPKPFPGAVLLVQHVDGEFSAGLASWLAETSGMRVELARVGSFPLAGMALLAGTEEHLIMTAGGSLRYTPTPRELPYRPSVDVLFASLAQHWKTPGAAVLLTGMGRDGAQGLKKLRQGGWLTVAQDEATSVVYGMPKAAVALGAAARVLPLDEIAAELAGFVSRRPAPRRARVSRRPTRG